MPGYLRALTFHMAIALFCSISYGVVLYHINYFDKSTQSFENFNTISRNRSKHLRKIVIQRKELCQINTWRMCSVVLKILIYFLWLSDQKITTHILDRNNVVWRLQLSYPLLFAPCHNLVEKNKDVLWVEKEFYEFKWAMSCWPHKPVSRGSTLCTGHGLDQF